MTKCLSTTAKVMSYKIKEGIQQSNTRDYVFLRCILLYYYIRVTCFDFYRVIFRPSEKYRSKYTNIYGTVGSPMLTK
jgi:hypothetical protein